MKKIYISGKITGLPFDKVRSKFAAAERKLTEQGYEAVSPLKTGIPYDSPWESHMAVDIVLLIGCDAVYFLPDWHLSKGARIENTIAEFTGKTIIYEEVGAVELGQAICKIQGISFCEIANDSRERKYVYARMIYAYFCKEHGATVEAIAGVLRRDHSTVNYYLRKFDDEIKFNPKFREIVNRIEALRSSS